MAQQSLAHLEKMVASRLSTAWVGGRPAQRTVRKSLPSVLRQRAQACSVKLWMERRLTVPLARMHVPFVTMSTVAKDIAPKILPYALSHVYATQDGKVLTVVLQHSWQFALSRHTSTLSTHSFCIAILLPRQIATQKLAR